MTRRLAVLLILALAVAGGFLWFRYGSGGGAALWALSREGGWLAPLVAVAALLDSINPCAISVLLITIAFLFSLGRAREDIVKIGGFYIFGIFAVYVLIGLGVLEVLHLFNTPHFVSKVAAVVLIGLGGIGVLGEIFPRFPLKLKIPQVSHHKMARLMERATYPTAFFLGGLVGLCEFPCTGGPYLLILGLLHDQGTYLSGLAYLALYNLIFVLPLVVILLLASETSIYGKFQEWKKNNAHRMRLLSAIAAVLLGALILIL